MRAQQLVEAPDTAVPQTDIKSREKIGAPGKKKKKKKLDFSDWETIKTPT